MTPFTPKGVSVLTFLQPYNLTETSISMPWGKGVAKRIYISITTPYSLPPLKTVMKYPPVRLLGC